MDGTRTVTSHPKHRAANDGVTWNSHCKHNILGPILPFPALGRDPGYARSTFGAGPENTCTKPARQGLQAEGGAQDFAQTGLLDKGLPGTLSQLGGVGAVQEEKLSLPHRRVWSA